MKTDFLIVGSGLTGAIIARTLFDAGRSVLVLERRDHVGGNVYDETHPSGIKVHTYGPHYFRTGSEKIWQLVNRFSDFYPYVACLKSEVDGRLESWPIAGSYIKRVIGENWSAELGKEVGNFEEACLSMMPRLIYEKFVKGYSEKQWGVPASALDASLAGRFDVRDDDDPRLKTQKYQGIPKHGYAALMRNILRDIPVLLHCDYLKNREIFNPDCLTIYTGPIDAYFNYDLGKLGYRGQLREHEYLPDIDCYQECGQVNNPSAETGAHIRTLEWKHMMEKVYADKIRGTLITRETTITPTEEDLYEYPFPDAGNDRLYRQYLERARAIPQLLVCGRLGEYRYYDMDQAIGRALTLAERILSYDRDRQISGDVGL